MNRNHKAHRIFKISRKNCTKKWGKRWQKKWMTNLAISTVNGPIFFSSEAQSPPSTYSIRKHKCFCNKKHNIQNHCKKGGKESLWWFNNCINSWLHNSKLIWRLQASNSNSVVGISNIRQTDFRESRDFYSSCILFARYACLGKFSRNHLRTEADHSRPLASIHLQQITNIGREGEINTKS